MVIGLKQMMKKWLPNRLIRMYQQFKKNYKQKTFSNKNIREVFTYIYKNNYWNNAESVSGPGSTIGHTKGIIERINTFNSHHEIRSILDIPCGDFNWMRHLNLSNIKYVGADIVEEMVRKNQQFYGRNGILFQTLDITKDSLPTCDLIINRDCLVHFSNELIFASLKNMMESKATFLMTTTFPDHQNNVDIITGNWRPINLTLPPFNLPQPMYVIEENTIEHSLQNLNRKILGVWKISDIKAIIV